MTAMNEDRSGLIRRFLYTSGYASVQAIADAVGASLATVRRDLMVLEAEGVIQRDHGGARIAQKAGIELAFSQRERQHLTEKRAIADLAYAMIRPDTTVFLDAGTTVFQLARRLRLNPKPVNIISNCIPIAQELADVAGVSVTLLGGRVRLVNASTVGIVTERALAELRFDQVFLGCSAVGADGAIYSQDADEARANALMLERASTRVVLTDSSKFGPYMTYRVAPLSAVQVVVSDQNLPDDWQERITGWGCDLRLAPVPRAQEKRA
jgi:DeoR/GlpR family transcriptional regulator of sugar metabolism